MKQKFTNLFWQEDKNFIGLCLELDVSSFGSTQEEAQAMLNEAIALTMEDTEPSDFRFPKIKNPKLIQSELQYA